MPVRTRPTLHRKMQPLRPASLTLPIFPVNRSRDQPVIVKSGCPFCFPAHRPGLIWQLGRPSILICCGARDLWCGVQRRPTEICCLVSSKGGCPLCPAVTG